MNSDLIDLNKRIATRKGLCESFIYTPSAFLSICLGRLSLSSSQLIALASTSTGKANPIDVININRDYLQHARLVAIRIVNGNDYSGLLQLGINLDQASVLSGLTNNEITQIAKYSDGEVFQTIATIDNLRRLHSSTRPRFVAALIAV